PAPGARQYHRRRGRRGPGPPSSKIGANPEEALPPAALGCPVISMELAKAFDPHGIESRWYPFWESRGYFKAGFDPAKPSFSIQLPPPNLTGTLHMGHAYQQTLMDVL